MLHDASTRRGSRREDAANVSVKLPLGSDSQLLGESDDEGMQAPSALPSVTNHDLGSLKRSSVEATAQRSAKKQRQAYGDCEVVLESQGVGPTPNADDDWQSLQTSQELVGSSPCAPGSPRKRVAGAAATRDAFGLGRDSEPLVRETVPVGGRSPHASQSDLSDPDSVRAAVPAHGSSICCVLAADGVAMLCACIAGEQE
jgi:hypothetical protein|eukprot:COSAG02_NODE_238_length_27685_cov_11.570792_7_plen_200_part_00